MQWFSSAKWFDLGAVFGIPPVEWLYAAVAVVASYLILSGLLRICVARLGRIAAKTSTHFDDIVVDVLDRTHRLTIVMASLLIGTEFIDLSAKLDSRISHLWFLVVGFQMALWVNHGVSVWTHRRLTSAAATAHNPVITTMMSWMLRALLWSVLLLAVLANMGVNITAFVASLGVGGVAVALAVQSILSDLFASLAIGLDKPFEIGDFIVFNDVAGSIEHIGLKTTRIRSLSGEQIVCSNTELLKNTIHNYKRMSERRIVFAFGVTYDAKPEQLKEVPQIVKAAVESAGNTRFDRAHFKQFGESSLDFEVVYYVTDPSFNLYMDIQQTINLDLMTGLAERGMDFAFPTRTLYVVGDAADQAQEDEPSKSTRPRVRAVGTASAPLKG
ncbi:mechanosensitive ion channel family protein [Caballeronia zhejiangensis]|uniref:Mechanosensitive ion channel protein MscS n=1 Tax=Caballeronia zhejiangensis TaxID=871203 RepID=A0A656Q9T8_9BURK|nr:mechanosensitive ion channel family protein [Caballeronia zhejiangensis]KDR24669.1 mechanosensitive ion channel protein MscS [Caballeronia zhejiangensis]